MLYRLATLAMLRHNIYKGDERFLAYAQASADLAQQENNETIFLPYRLGHLGTHRNGLCGTIGRSPIRVPITYKDVR